MNNFDKGTLRIKAAVHLTKRLKPNVPSSYTYANNTKHFPNDPTMFTPYTLPI